MYKARGSLSDLLAAEVQKNKLLHSASMPILHWRTPLVLLCHFALKLLSSLTFWKHCIFMEKGRLRSIPSASKTKTQKVFWPRVERQLQFWLQKCSSDRVRILSRKNNFSILHFFSMQVFIGHQGHQIRNQPLEKQPIGSGSHCPFPSMQQKIEA